MSEASTTPLKPAKTLIHNDSEIRVLRPRQKPFHAIVPNVKGLRLKIKPNGNKLWEVVAKGPDGKPKTRGLGSFPEVSFKQATQKGLDAFREIKEGIDPRYQRQKLIRKSYAISKAQRSIVQLATEHVEQKVLSGEVRARSAENDYRSIKQIQSVIGNCTFLGFGLQEAKALSRAFPEKTSYAARDKTKKMIAKTYRGLDQATQREIDEDVPRLLQVAYGTIKKRTRAEQTIPTHKIGEFWWKLISIPCPSRLHKEALALALLTGERKEAILSIEIKNIHIEKHQCIYVEGKTSRGTPTKNLIPLTPILGTLVQRMADRAISSGSPYLFPKQRLPQSNDKPMAKPHLTNINKAFIEKLGEFDGVRPGPHNLRRTLANVAATILGSQDLAQEHILHFNKHTSGAKHNYFDQASLDFLETRRETFEKCHRKIDDLILNSRTICTFVEDDESGKPLVAGLGVTFGSRETHQIMNTQGRIASMEEIQLYEPLKVASPLAVFASDEPVYVDVRNRPLFEARLLDEWVSFDILANPTDFKSRIE